jgi:flagellin
MPTVINTNLASLYAQGSLNNAQNNLATSVQRLSSGLRINSAKDDASGLAVAQNMQAQINGINQSVRNLTDATGLLQVADTAMSVIQDMLLRMKQLSTQGYNGSISNDQRQNLLDEVKALNTQINNIATSTKYNGNTLINQSSAPTLNISGKNAGEATSVTTVALTYSNINVAKAANAVNTYAATSPSAGKINLSNGGTLTQTLDLASLPSVAAGGSVTLNFDQLGIEVSFVAPAGITGTQIAAAMVGDTIVTAVGAASSLDFMAGSDTGVSNLISVAKINTRTDGSGDATVGHAAMTVLGTQITAVQTAITGGVSATIATAFQTLGTNVDSAVNQVSNDRSVFGAQMNQIAYISQNLTSQSTNVQNSKSSILDTDFAAETARLTKGQIMQQAATAMLAQANQMPNVILSLLK